jgi:hypothetical protein
MADNDCMDNVLEGMSGWYNGFSLTCKCIFMPFCIAAVALLTYLCVSIEAVEPIQFALIRSNIDQSIDTKRVLEGGLHFVGVFYSLIQYNSTQMHIEFSNERQRTQTPILTRTSEGLELTLSCSFQYKLNKTLLPKFYRYYEKDYEKKITRIARKAILKVSADWKAG